MDNASSGNGSGNPEDCPDERQMDRAGQNGGQGNGGHDEYCDHGSNSTDEGISVTAGTESIVSASVSVVEGRREAAMAAARSDQMVPNGQIPRCLVSEDQS